MEEWENSERLMENLNIKLKERFEYLTIYPQCNTGQVIYSNSVVNVVSYLNGIEKDEGESFDNETYKSFDEAFEDTNKLILKLIKENSFVCIRKFPTVTHENEGKYIIWTRIAASNEIPSDLFARYAENQKRLFHKIKSVKPNKPVATLSTEMRDKHWEAFCKML